MLQRFAFDNDAVTIVLLLLSCVAVAVARESAAQHHCIHDKIRMNTETIPIAQQVYEARVASSHAVYT